MLPVWDDTSVLAGSTQAIYYVSYYVRARFILEAFYFHSFYAIRVFND